MNAINIIEIYKWKGFWVFDDPSTGLVHEALVMGTDKIIDVAVANIENADKGFICIFSGTPLPEYDIKLVLHKRGNNIDGNWYRSEELDMDGWLCPALYKYFEVEPDAIYLKIEPKTI
jgi:hypothetical protein